MLQKIFKSIFSSYERRMVVYFLLFILLGFTILVLVLSTFS
jgi:hypothetical protein